MRVRNLLLVVLIAALAALSFSSPVAFFPEDNIDDDSNSSEDVELEMSNSFVLANSDPAQYTFSAVHSSCTNIATIDAPGAWCTADGNTGFMVIDLKRVMNIEGIQTQGRADCCQQWVSEYAVAVSSDGVAWKLLGQKSGNSDAKTKVNNFFQERARYVRISVVSKNNHASMRADVLLSKTQDALPLVNLANSDPAQYTFSAVHASCTNIATIDAPGAWCTADGNAGFMVIDLKRVMNVEGVQTQGRPDCCSQWVSAGEISFSVDGQRWENMGRFPLNSDKTTKVNTYVAGEARYVRIAVVSRNEHASMRADVLLSETQDPLPTVEVWTPPASAFKFSDTHSSCSNAAGAMINGNGGWCTASGGTGSTMVIDAGDDKPIAGVATQGRSDHDQWVSRYAIATSADGSSWTDYGSYPGNSDRNTVVSTFIFPTVNARYVRITVNRAGGSHSSMRAGLLIQTKAPRKSSDAVSISQLNGIRSDTQAYDGKHTAQANVLLNMLDRLLFKLEKQSKRNQNRIERAEEAQAALTLATKEIAMIHQIKKSIHCFNGQPGAC